MNEKIESAIDRQKRLERYKKYREEQAGKFKRVSATFSSQEYRKLKAGAKRYHLKPTAFLKACWLEKEKQGVLIPVEQEQKMEEITFLLRNVANNTNQIARVANTQKETNFSTTDSLKILHKLSEDIQGILKK